MHYILLFSTEGHIVIVLRNSNYQLPEYQQNFKTLCEKLEHDGKIRKIAVETFPGYHPGIEGIVLHYQKIA